jgi:hypothetical protein
MATVKNILSTFTIMGCLALGMYSCNRSKFAGLNTDPDAVLSIDPKTELTPGETGMVSNDFEVFYDFIRNIKPWTQVYVPVTGNTSTFLQTGGNIGQRWSSFYGGVGDDLEDVIHIIDNMSAAKALKYQYLRAITMIPLAYYAFYVSDDFDRIPYAQAFKARYTTPPLLTPVYDAQQSLFDSLDTQLKNAVAVLESSPAATQEALGGNDIFYGGDPAHWIKAANSLRLKMAMRLIKQDPARLTSIVNEVLADNVGLMAGTADDWIVYSTTIGTGTNSNPFSQTIYSGSHNTVSFMSQTADPRLRTFYQQSGINTQDIFDSAKAQGALPDTLTWDGLAYRGQYVSPGTSSDATRSFWFQKLNFSYKGVAQSTYYPSMLQAGLTYYTYNNTTGGVNMFPIITYADVCFMRAELKLRGLSNDPMSAQDLYNAGITASINNYDQWGKNTLAPDYAPLGANEITNYLAQPGIAFNPSNALEQVCVQEYLNYFVVPNECWALIKRTGYPSTTGNILRLEDVSAYGVMPRRYPITAPLLSDLNYNNETIAIDSMTAEPNFGQINDITGRVWWDQPN